MRKQIWITEWEGRKSARETGKLIRPYHADGSNHELVLETIIIAILKAEKTLG